MKGQVRNVDARQMSQRFKIDKRSLERYTQSKKQAQELPQTEPTVTIIKPMVQTDQPKLKVASYCRVSSLREIQQSSIENQKEHYEEQITRNPAWEFAGSYFEAGVTGTKAEVRPELQRLISDCKEGKVDLILTKSISRFSRNTQDCLEMVRLLTSLGVNIWFEKENIRTDSMDSEFMLSILACFAEYESFSISRNVKWGIKKRFQDGTYRQAIPPFGYEWVGDELKVKDSEADIVRLIFQRTLSGSGSKVICDELNAKGISSPTGKEWTQNSIRMILNNPAYIGDMLYQKTFIDETFRQRKNKGEMDQYYDEGHHVPLVSKQGFEKAKGIRGTKTKEPNPRYPFTGILVCSSCGSIMHRDNCNRERVAWICHRHNCHPDICSMLPQGEKDLQAAFINCLNKLAWAPEILKAYEELLGQTNAEKNKLRLQQIDKELDTNRKEMAKLRAKIMRERFLPEHRERNTFLTIQQKNLINEKNTILISGEPDGSLQRLRAFVSGWEITDDPEKFPETAFTTFVESCTVDTNKAVIFHFKCGLSLTESLERSYYEKRN